MIAIVDSGGANLASVIFAIERLGNRMFSPLMPMLSRKLPTLSCPASVPQARP